MLKGRARVVPVKDVDTDMIFHNRHLHITDNSEMGQYIFGNLSGWEKFHKTIEEGDILVCGHNFGCGSSRQQAVDGFIALGIAAIVGESFGAIYRRNVINAGLPLIECPGILDTEIEDGEGIILELSAGTILNADGIKITQGEPLSDVQRDIYFAGGLLELAKT